MSILIDSRVGSAEYLDAIAARVNCTVRLTQLDSADIAFEGNGPDGNIAVGIELKHMTDALNSMRSGRMVEQLDKMLQDYQLVCFIIHGIYRPGESGFIECFTRGEWVPLSLGPGKQNYYYAELDKFMSMLELKKNCVVKRATTKLEVVWQIVNLYSLLQKDWDSHSSTEAIKIQSTASLFRKASVLRMVSAQLPGVGWHRSKAVAQKFRTVEALANALPTELEQVDGIGKKTALGIYKAIRTDEEL